MALSVPLQRRVPLREALAPRSPDLGIFALIIAPVALTISLAIPVVLSAGGAQVSFLAMFWYVAVPFAGIATGLLIAQAWAWVTPPRLRGSHNLVVALAVSYLPYLGGVLAAVWFGLWLLVMLPFDVRPLSHGITATIIGGAAGLWLLVAVLGNHLSAMRHRDRLNTSALAVLLEDLTESRQRIVTAQEGLRKEVAQGLHGPVQNRLLVASLRLKQSLGAGPGDTTSQVMDAITLIDDVIKTDLRDLMTQLHPSVIRLGLPAALRSLIGSQLGDIGVRLWVDQAVEEMECPSGPGLPEVLRLTLYRVAQDALNNVLKHSRATHVSVTLTAEGLESIALEIEDNGCGLNKDRLRPGMGILSMRDYCGAQGGTLTLESETGRGTRVAAYLPFQAQEGRHLHMKPVSAPEHLVAAR